MAEGFIEKKIGPFSGGVWIIIVAGGIGLAIVIKKGMGGGGGEANQPILVETVPLKKSGGATSDNDPTKPDKVPPPSIPMPLPPKPSPLPVPQPVPTCPSGMNYDPVQKKCVPFGYNPVPPSLPRPPTVPAPRPPTPAPINRAPGGYSTGCDGIGYFPPDYAARMNMPTAKFQDRAIKLSWAVLNIAAGPPGIFAFTQYLSSPAVWGLENGRRRSRGLRAMTEGEWRSLITDLNGIIARLGGKENRLTNADIMSIWSKYNTPFVCAQAVQHRETRQTQRAGAA